MNVPESGKVVVLIAEDDRGMRGTLEEVLTRHGFATLTATSGDEVVEVSRRERPDLILMDVMMPLLDGYAAARVLKRDPATMSIPIIAFNAPQGGSRGRRVRCLRPYDERHLLERIHDALEKRNVGDSVRA